MTLFRLLPSACFVLTAAAQPVLQEAWEKEYTGEDANGKHVLGYWKFDAAGPLLDSSGKGNDLVNNGAAAASEGRFGEAIESFPGFPISDKPHSMRVSTKGRLSANGPFTVEMWIKPKPEFEKTGRCYLLDKKYVPDHHADYAWQIWEGDKTGPRRLAVTLGFGSLSETFHSEPVALPVGEWQHIAFNYDAAGTVTFYRNGSVIGRATKPGLKAVTPGTRALYLGDRSGSNYGGFPGFIDEVRLCDGALRFEPVALEIASQRSVWRRMERAVPVSIICTNLRRETVNGAALTVEFAGKKEEFLLPDLKPGAAHTATFNVNTALKPQAYRLHTRLQAGGAVVTQDRELKIVPRPSPNQMPVIMWGASAAEADRLKDIGFTHCLGLHADIGDIWSKKEAVPPGKPEMIAANIAMLDRALENNIGVISSLSPGRLFEGKTDYLRVGRDGKPYPRQDICASLPELRPFFENVGRSVSKTYGSHPAFAATLVNTEVRDASQPSFNPVDVENYRQFAKADIPAEVVNRWGVDWTKLPGFPQDRVIAQEHPILTYYRWFWTVGDGWNGLHTALAKGIRSGAQRQHFTFFDPAVRQPSISGAGGAVDVIAHWTYTYPDPQRIGLCTDQLFAMSEASGLRQRVMKMTQLIWYRSQTAPIGKGQPGETVAWEDHDPDAAYITIAPMHLKEAFWTKLARPVQGIMYHGWGSLVPTDSPTSYRYTHPDTVHVLRDLIENVVKPLGPALMSIPDQRSEVALLESFTSQMFARRGGYGSNNNWSADLWMALQHAHVQTDILYEETVLKKNGLSGRRFLIMPECDVLTAPVVARIQDWQKKGGKIVADEFLCPALKADFVLPSFKRIKKADADKASVLALARKVRELALPQMIACDNPEVIVRTRRFGDALYVFAVNDRREFGTYVGQHGLVMENGLPSSAMLTLKQENANVYDLTRSQFLVPQRLPTGEVKWPVDLGPCDGRIFMITPKPLLKIALEVPESATVGNRASVKAAISTSQEGMLKAVVPVRIEVRDSSGKTTEGTGAYAAENGIVSVDLDIAANEEPGTWEIRVKELASGMEAVRYLRVGR
jgi:hypothetical protein